MRLLLPSLRSAVSARSGLILAPAALLACIFVTGCAQRVYGPPPPPPPPLAGLVAQASDHGYHAGFEDGERDAANGVGYHPRYDRKYATTPGYYPEMGPYRPYRDAFRDAYLRGYTQGYHHG